MTLVTSFAWIPEAEERRRVRDTARRKFVAEMGVKPIKSLDDLALSPAAQRPVVDALIKKANPQGSPDIDEALLAVTSALSNTGFGEAGIMAGVGKALIGFGNLVPQRLAETYFSGDSDE